MSDPQRVHVGEILRGIRAADHNAFYDTWRKVNQLPPPNTPNPQGQFSNRLVVAVFNESGALIDCEFPILKLTGPVFTTDDRESVIYQAIAFNGDTPAADTENEDIVIVQGPIGAGMKGHGVMSGLSWVKVNWTDEAHTHAAVEDGENTRLKSAASGIKIIWHVEIPDPEYLPMELWALVLLGGGSGSGEGKRTWVLLATALIPGGESSESFTLVQGDAPVGGVQNLSARDIFSGQYMVGCQVGDGDVVYNAFCPEES